MLLVALPDEVGSYSYFATDRTCKVCQCRTIHTDRMFRIIANNMFNRKDPRRSACHNHAHGQAPHLGNDHSYVYPVKWDDFVADINGHLDIAWGIRERENEFLMVKQL